MADTPNDLAIVPQTSIDKNYFNVKVVGLKIDKSYSFQFQWILDDGTLSDWSPGYQISTPTEGVPSAPSATVPSTAIGNIPVTLSSFPANTKRVDIYIIGGVYGVGKVADSFLSAGTKNISVVAGVYQVSLVAVTTSGINGDPTNTFTITISNLVPEDTIAPNAILTGVVTGGVHPQDSSGQLGYLNVAVTNSTIPVDFAGYIVKIVSSTNTWTQTFNSTTALSNLYITGGLFVGQAYTLSVATTDGKNVSSYINCSPAPFTITDTRSNTSTVTGSLSFSATDSILNVSWAASTDSYVNSYRVQITSNADTTFATPLQTVESKGTTVSFGGLTSSTTYRIRVTTRYSGSNALSTNHTTGTVTLNASGAISDGNVPTKNPNTGAEPLIVVKSLFKAFALNWSDIDNPDQVTYEVYVKTVNSTSIVDPANLVMEINGTFAVINSLKDGTAIAYPAETSPTTATDYYFAVRAKDADGISSAAVTPIGPFTASRTGQFDIATNAIYANHITAGEITADKMTTDLLFVNKTISVGESTSLNRIRLASSILTPVIMTDSELASPSTYSVKSRIFIGVGNYYSVGTPFYADNTGRFSLANKLRFDGTDLLINGSGTFSGTVTAGTGPTVSIGTNVQSTNSGVYISGTGDYIYSDGRVRLGNGGITYASGVLTVRGNIEATSINATTSLSGLSITGTSGTIGGITLNSSGLSATNFSISSTGLITANAGTIGGWAINSTQLRSNGANQISLNQGTPKIALITGATLNGATGLYEGGTEVITIDPISGIVGPSVTVAGNTGPGFSLSPNGTAIIRGTIYASAGVFSGNVTGATITTSKLTSPQGTFSIDTYSSYDQIRWSVGGAVSTLGYVASGMNWDGPGYNGFQMTTAGNTVISSWGNEISLSAGTQQSVSYVSGGASGQNTFIVNSVASLSVGKYLVSGAGQVGNPFLGAPNRITAINAGTNQITMTYNFTSQASGNYVFKGPTTKSSGGLAYLYSSNSPSSLGLRNSIAMSSADATSYGISNSATVNQNYYAFYEGDVVFSY